MAVKQNPSSEQPLRVLLWSPKGAGLHYGGPGMSAYRLYSKADPGQFGLTLAHANPHQEQYGLFAEQHLIHPIERPNPFSQWRFLAAAKQWLADNHQLFDVFHGLQGFHLTVAPAAWARRASLPAVVKLAAYQSDLADKRGWKSLLALPRRRRKMLAGIDGVIAISDAIASELLSYGLPESKIARIPNGVDTDTFRPVRDEEERRHARETLGWLDLPTVLFVGGLTPRKNPMVLIEAIGQLLKRNLDCQLLIVGPDNDPPYTQAMKDRVRALGIEGRVFWHGFTPDVALLYRGADLYALPSSNEGMPNALLEAMASGLPSVVTPISGTIDLIQDDVSGCLVPAKADAVAQGLAAYLDSPGTAAAHGKAARLVIEQRYSARAVLAAHDRLFRRIMAGGPAAE